LIRGGGPGDPINLDSVPVLSVAYFFFWQHIVWRVELTYTCSWKNLIMDEFAPAYLNANPDGEAYVTNVTHASTLVRDPNIKITTRSANAFGGSIDLEAAPSKYDKSVGNLEKEFVPFMIYNYAVQQAGWEIVGETVSIVWCGDETPLWMLTHLSRRGAQCLRHLLRSPPNW
jgi:hypothetical protein